MTASRPIGWTLLAAALMSTACADTGAQDGPEMLTADEERQLDAAAERLDAEREAAESEMAAQIRADAARTATTDDPETGDGGELP